MWAHVEWVWQLCERFVISVLKVLLGMHARALASTDRDWLRIMGRVV